MPNAYVTVDLMKGSGALNLTGTAYDSRLLVLIEAVSRQVDRYCGRHFYPVIETRYIDGDGGKELHLPDIVSVDTLKEDTNQDGTFETSWSAAGTDYHYWPYNANPTAEWGRPYTSLIVSKNSIGTQDIFISGQRNYEVVGTWGYRRMLSDTGQRGSGTLAASGTLFPLTASSTLEMGMTIVLDSEMIYVGTGGTATSTINVQRAVNGSTGTAHSTATVNRVVYPAAVVEAVFIQTARLWKRKDSAFANQIGMPETGQLMVFEGGLDKDLKSLLSPYRRIAV